MTEPDRPPKPITLRRGLATGLAMLIPVIPIVVGLVLSSGSSGAAAGTTRAASHFQPVPHPPASRGTSQSSSTASRTPAQSSSTASRAPAQSSSTPAEPTTRLPGGTGAVVALVRHAGTLHTRPGGRVLAKLPSHTQFGSPTVVLVSKVSGPWLGVIATAAGNNRIGWIRASAVSLTRVDWRLHAVLSRHELIVSLNGRAIRHFTIAVGMPDAPTPTGHFAVTDRLKTGDPAGPYGCCIVAISAKAPHAISDWDGGNRIAIHSTPETASIGKSVSHGCMRLTLPEGQWLLTHIPLGTPVDVST